MPRDTAPDTIPILAMRADRGRPRFQSLAMAIVSEVFGKAAGWRVGGSGVRFLVR